MASRPTSEIFSRSSTSSKGGPEDEETRAHSAAHIISGAVTSVLGPKSVTEIGSGSMIVRSDEALTPQDVSKVEAAANDKVSDDAEFLEFEMERGEAEGHFGKGIYDLAAPADDGSLVRIVRIPEWDASICSRKHVESTGNVGEIKVETARFDSEKKQIELGFYLVH